MLEENELDRLIVRFENLKTNYNSYVENTIRIIKEEKKETLKTKRKFIIIVLLWMLIIIVNIIFLMYLYIN